MPVFAHAVSETARNPIQGNRMNIEGVAE
jgi:hypothetical protein